MSTTQHLPSEVLGTNVERLLNKFTLATYVSLHQLTALYTAVKQGHIGIVRCLVDNGAEVDIKDNEEVCATILI